MLRLGSIQSGNFHFLLQVATGAGIAEAPTDFLTIVIPNYRQFESITHAPIRTQYTLGTEVRTFALDHMEWN
jgi:hypothetical protein